MLVLCIVVGAGLLALRDFLRPMIQRATDAITQAITGQFFKPGNFHQLPVGR